MLTKLERVVTVNDEDFYPVILKTDDEYSYEGSHMKHCVALYATYDHSLIISLRKGSVNGHDRITCEYSVGDKTLRQARSFCNQPPPIEFEEPLKVLHDRIAKYPGTLEFKEKIKTPIIRLESKIADELITH